ncbi:Serine/threonine-protein kinase tel1 [Vermiconidia calcicola]|uniref:Serine/threonine-protein kinase tel1 n=1 Tax=Vermiconidia calcicola TaxID=1690605 RepID=A0ACC3MB53_9PEZI|nr:Serine/threonine-protein kinase tel1 [Vermiconidia calcicola]
MRGEITLADALERIEGNTLKDRADGLADLKHILRNNSKLETLSDGSFHRIYEVLFVVAVSEQSTYVKAKTGKIRTAAEKRLSNCASALRLAVEVAVRIVKLKTVKSVLDHITETLLLPGGQLCEPIALDYARCLRALLSYQAHVEHLRDQERERTARFCVECIHNADCDVEDDDAASGAEIHPTADAFTGLSYRSSRSHLKDSGGSQGGRSLEKQIAEEMVVCLSLLTAAPNASHGTSTATLLWALIDFLKKTSVTGRAHQDAFAAINHILAWTRTEDIGLTRKATGSIVRLIRFYWSIKSSSPLKDEMLITCSYLRPYFFSAMQHDDGLTARPELSSLLDVMKMEYGKRQDRDQLHVEDLRFEFADMPSRRMNSIHTAIFGLRCGNTRAEGNWATVDTLSSLSNVLSNRSCDEASSDEEDGLSPRPRKRQRLTDEFDENFASSISGSTPSRVCALQILMFLAQQKAFSSKQILKTIDKLSVSCAEDNALVASWALLALASFASQATSTDPLLSARWTSVWQLATRAISNAYTCRPACHLIRLMLVVALVPQRSVAEFMFSTRTSIDLNGPSTLSDSAAHLLAYVVRTAQQSNPTTSSAIAESILSWLLRNFLPSKFEDKSYASQQNSYLPGDIVQLISCCLGQSSHTSNGSQFPIWDTISHAWLACSKQQDLLQYLLLLPEPSVVAHEAVQAPLAPTLVLQPRTSCEPLLLNHLLAELSRAHDAWAKATHERPKGISLDVFNFLCTAYCVSTCVAFCYSFRDGRRQAQLQKQVLDTLKLMADFISSPSCGQDKIDAMLVTFSCACARFLISEPQVSSSECEKHLCPSLYQGLESRQRSKELNGQDDDEDAMELDNEPESQDSRHGTQFSTTSEIKNEYAANYSNISLRSSMELYATIVYAQNVSRLKKANTPSASALVVDYILSLPEASILSSRWVITRLSDLYVDLTTDDAYRLLDYCAENILQAYPYERSEVATGVILDIMSSLVSAWTEPANDSLFELGLQLYHWYTTTALSGGVLSPNVQKRVASLLLQLCHVNTDYGKDNSVSSVRTSLFKLLQLGSISLQFHLAHRISTIFGLFVLSNHSAMFNDLQESLPADAEWVEGMAMRLLFFGKLAAAWHSLLRQCVYYIFETAGRVKASANHAARSISELAGALNFGSPQKLFRLFAPQLLHTWLESHTVTSLPYVIFEFESLTELLAHNRSEITAQLLVRGNDDGMQAVMSALKDTNSDLVIGSFAKCLGYCICWDISHPPPSNEDNSESRLRKLVGSKEEFRSLIVGQFATIMAQFYLSLQQEDVQDRWLEKRTEYGAAAKALSEMKSFSHSDRTLPTSQQPSFKSKYLCDQIQRLCRRTSHNPVQPWSSSSFALAARILLDSVDEALGPLHTCLVIRKLRLLICMAGDVPLSGFPLEMMIHSLRPFLSDSECADDAIGVLQYLFHRGQPYLRTNLAFSFGTATLMVLQMCKHSASRQESTTQESQHRSTLQRMQSLRDWLVSYLQRCVSSNDSVTSNDYVKWTEALAQVSLPGNARKGTAESSLLLLLLVQEDTQEALLPASDRDEAVAALSENFDPPTSTAEDCLGDDNDSARFSQKLWAAMQITSLSDTFVAWIAGVVGRTYASTGARPVLVKSLSHGTTSGAMDHKGVAASQAAVTRRLCDMLFSRDRFEASIADYTLRSIVHSFTDAEEALAFEQMLPAVVVPAIAEGTHGYEPGSAPSNIANVPVRVGTSLLRSKLEVSTNSSLEEWVQELSLTLCQDASGMAFLPALKTALQHSARLALDLLPCIVHIILVKEMQKEPVLRMELSTSLAKHFEDNNEALRPKQQYLIRLLLYLRSQSLPGENTQADRLRWLEIDWIVASQAADRCGMPTTALLLAESSSQPVNGSRRSSRASLSQVSIAQIPQELLLSVFKAVDEPDSFYGVEQPASFASVLDRLDYEADGYRSLMFRSAQIDSDIRRSHQLAEVHTRGMVNSLSMLNLDSLTFALLSRGPNSADTSENFLNSARRLQQWDVTVPEAVAGPASHSFSVYRELSRANERATMQRKLQALVIAHTKPMTALEQANRPSHEWLSVLASLVETGEVINSSVQSGVRTAWKHMQLRQSWMKVARFDDFRTILSSRHTLFSTIAQNKSLSAALGAGLKDCRIIEIESLLSISRFGRGQGQLQEALTASSQSGNLVDQCRCLGLKADAAVKLETASVLWQSSEATASVKMLRDALDVPDLETQDVPVGRSGLLAQLAHQLAEARLEKPDEILSKYLKPAINHLQGRSDGQEAGRVFQEFASFCDKQLQNPGNIEDLNRITKLRQRKLEEVQELEKLSKGSRKSGGDKVDHTREIQKAKQWYNIDDADYQRLRRNRETFMQQSLQNYLLALKASDDHDISILRFFALWLENSEIPAANAVVGKYLAGVPSWKFVVLMNQLMSRLEQESSTFQSALKALVHRLCAEHPHHSLYHLYATTRKPSSKDQAAQSRYEVAMNIRKQVQNDPKKGDLLKKVFSANGLYTMLAVAEADSVKGTKVATKDFPSAAQVARSIPDLKVPPATITVPLRRDSNYTDVPTIMKFGSTVNLMSGLSRPKKLTAYASDGKQYPQLFKSGNDDLRQDAIMEQVFEEVSKMLQNHKATRQRNLHVRTYKVIPLSTRSGIIDFVPNSTSFSDFLVSAHERYHPQDYKNSSARNKINAAKEQSTETRIKEFRKVCEHMQPVLRHFFFERYKDPDEWFEKRTAYTRTTATVSILGHVLGLGDRHCQNIMLDEKTGEVVHIDLGVAFEAGRVLPVPELVPFRLTRDVIDGMGITKTEGVFRRCCEFTMEALREDKDSIMTLLNVLRYDPLYTWSVSPLRAKRMQEETGRNAGDPEAEGSSKKKEQEAGEADRALSIVEKKLSKTLSTAATVNELIQQATDERNLATLFSGWSAYF